MLHTNQLINPIRLPILYDVRFITVPNPPLLCYDVLEFTFPASRIRQLQMNCVFFLVKNLFFGSVLMEIVSTLDTAPVQKIVTSLTNKMKGREEVGIRYIFDSTRKMRH